MTNSNFSCTVCRQAIPGPAGAECPYEHLPIGHAVETVHLTLSPDHARHVLRLASCELDEATDRLRASTDPADMIRACYPAIKAFHDAVRAQVEGAPAGAPAQAKMPAPTAGNPGGCGGNPARAHILGRDGVCQLCLAGAPGYPAA
jgi:hypothetical protein